MKIYTRTGDAGETGLRGGRRASKGSARVAACGEVDELNAALGVAAAALAAGAAPAPAAGGGAADRCAELLQLLSGVQVRLFELGAELASAAPEAAGEQAPEAVAELELAIDRLDASLEPLRHFVLPGGCPAAASLHLARTVCRRAERAVVRLAELETVGGAPLRYLNRLSDLLFVMARVANAAAGTAETPWPGGSAAPQPPADGAAGQP